MYIGFNANPSGKNVGDCVVRAISKALGLIWEDAYIALVTEGFKYHDMPSSNFVWGMLLHRHGFTQHMLPYCPYCVTVSEFAKDHPTGTYVLSTGSHTVTLIDGDWYDSWDSSDEIINSYWSKEEE